MWHFIKPGEMVYLCHCYSRCYSNQCDLNLQQKKKLVRIKADIAFILVCFKAGSSWYIKTTHTCKKSSLHCCTCSTCDWRCWCLTRVSNHKLIFQSVVFLLDIFSLIGHTRSLACNVVWMSESVTGTPYDSQRTKLLYSFSSCCCSGSVCPWRILVWHFP